MLHGHERAITQLKFNREGDLLFTASKDKQSNVWHWANGERLGTFDGHQGSVWCVDSNWESTLLLSGSGDNTLRLWDCQTGEMGILFFEKLKLFTVEVKKMIYSMQNVLPNTRTEFYIFLQYLSTQNLIDHCKFNSFSLKHFQLYMIFILRNGRSI